MGAPRGSRFEKGKFRHLSRALGPLPAPVCLSRPSLSLQGETLKTEGLRQWEEGSWRGQVAETVLDPCLGDAGRGGFSKKSFTTGAEEAARDWPPGASGSKDRNGGLRGHQG